MLWHTPEEKGGGGRWRPDKTDSLALIITPVRFVCFKQKIMFLTRKESKSVVLIWE